MVRFRSRLALKIVLPFALLTLAIGAIGTLAATGELNARGQQAFDRQLIHDGFVAQAMLQTADAERRSILRVLTGGSGIATVWDKPDQLQPRLERVLAIHNNTIVETVDPYGREIVGVFGRGDAQTSVSRNQDLSTWPGLQYALTGGGGEKIELVAPSPRPAVYTGQLLRDASGGLLGAVLVGYPLEDAGGLIRAAVHDDVNFYDPHGRLLSSTIALPPEGLTAFNLDPDTRNRVNPSTVVQLPRNVGGPGIELLAPWGPQAGSFGYFGVLTPSGTLLADTSRLRFIMVGLFLTAVLLTLLIGTWLARRITRPVHNLVEATRLVSAGDLDHQAPVTTHDEIGELTQSFNQMTQSLREKSVTLKYTMTQLQDTYLMTIEALAAAVEARDPYTHGHTRRVGQYAVVMAKLLGASESEIHALRRAAVLHDIGKIGIEDHILRKQGRLEADEELRMQRHPVIGVEMLKGIDFLDPVLPLIRHHHERWDGHGYPDQLRADEIPAGARILAVADAVDAMTSDRPYRAARTFEYAKAEILKGSGTHFDPEVVTAFIKSQHEIEELLRESASTEVHHHPDPGDLSGWRLHVVGR
jgi:putative nucleotidyltransferase with HDIG domain